MNTLAALALLATLILTLFIFIALWLDFYRELDSASSGDSFDSRGDDEQKDSRRKDFFSSPSEDIPWGPVNDGNWEDDFFSDHAPAEITPERPAGSAVLLFIPGALLLAATGFFLFRRR